VGFDDLEHRTRFYNQLLGCLRFPLPSMQPSIAAKNGESLPLFERSEFGQAPFFARSAGNPRSGQIVGSGKRKQPNGSQT